MLSLRTLSQAQRPGVAGRTVRRYVAAPNSRTVSERHQSQGGWPAELSDAFEEVGRADAQRFGQVAETLVKKTASSPLYVDEDVSRNSRLRGQLHLR